MSLLISTVGSLPALGPRNQVHSPKRQGLGSLPGSTQVAETGPSSGTRGQGYGDHNYEQQRVLLQPELLVMWEEMG